MSCATSQRRPWNTLGGWLTTLVDRRRHGTGGSKRAISLTWPKAGDRAAADFAIGQARQWLDHGRREDEPFWLDFWGPTDLAWHETRVALASRKGKSAEVAARSALARVGITSFPRNHVLYKVGLSSVLTQLGQFDEAISVISDAIHRVHEIRGSGRIIPDLRHTVDLLGQQKYAPPATFAAAAPRLLPASLV